MIRLVTGWNPGGLVMRHASFIVGFSSIAALGAAVAAHAQSAGNPVVLQQVEIEVGRTHYVTAPLPGATVTGVHSNNQAVRAYAYRINQVQIAGDKPVGRVEVDFWDSAHRIAYRQPVWVVNSATVASAGYDRSRVQLPQIIIPPQRSQPVNVPGYGPHQISRPATSNPAAVTARTDTANRIMVYSVNEGDAFIDFTDNATRTRYQVHVWVRKNAGQPNGGGSGGNGGGGQRRPIKQIRGVTGPVGKFDQCLVGRWRSVSIRATSGSGSSGGGAGILTTIKPDGTILLDYDGMHPTLGGWGVTNRLSGKAVGRIGISAGKVVVLRVDSSNLTHTFAGNGQVRVNSLGRSLGYGVPGFHPFAPTYHCTAETLTYSDFVDTYSFVRLGR